MAPSQDGREGKGRRLRVRGRGPTSVCAEGEGKRLDRKDMMKLTGEGRRPRARGGGAFRCNSTTKEILRSLPKGASVADMIKHVVNEEHTAPVQVAVQTTVDKVMACFKCGQVGHVVANCPCLPKGPCWACGKKGHFAKECRSKKQGNGKGRRPPIHAARRPLHCPERRMLFLC
uniref:CCHC-type domain-containing protein n=1 Tax=Strix occidentalis caurina TaxID=311401 RepID=A0A8D0FFY2_STROC